MISFQKLSYMEGILLFIFSGIMCVPLVIDLSSNNIDGYYSFSLGIVACCFLAGVFFFATDKPDTFQLNLREKFVFIVGNWLIFPLVAALPFLMSVMNVSSIDALFETTSAVTAAGASLLPDIDELTTGFIFWRSFLQLIGCVFFIISNLFLFSDLSELIIPHLTINSDRDTVLGLTKIVFSLYFGVAFIASLMLIGNGLQPLESCCFSFAAISGGGLSAQDGYISDNNVLNFVMISLMFLSGISVVFFRNIIERSEVKDTQLRFYVGIVFVATLISALSGGNLHNFANDIHKSLFNVLSAITTNGMTIEGTDSFSNSFMYLLNFLGGCFGSGTGGIKILRCIVVFTLIKSYLSKVINPNALYIPTYNGQKIETSHLSGLFVYFSCYMCLALILSGCLTISDFGFTKSFGAVLTSMNNNGPYFGLTKASPAELATVTLGGKITLMLSMIAGRLEFVPLFIVPLRSFWKKGK